MTTQPEPNFEQATPHQAIGIVVIGRNEGSRLTRCLNAITSWTAQSVYVDSASTDDSVARAQSVGFDVVELDPQIRLTAARGRVAGVQHLLERHPHLQYIQFIDGDCEMIDGWFEAAAQSLDAHPQWAVVCGRLRERDRDASIYNRLCDLEWQRPAGPTEACGGIFMARVQAYQQVGGFNTEIPAGEEPELCLRLRQAGWQIHRLAQPMAWHDADMHRFGQWWRRAKRSGQGDLMALQREGWVSGTRAVKSVISIWLWVMILPVLLIVGALLFSPWVLLGFAVYPLQVARTALRERRRRDTAGDAWLYAGECMAAKWPQAFGQMAWLFHRH